MKGDIYRGNGYPDVIARVCEDLKSEIMGSGKPFESTLELIGQSFEIITMDKQNGYCLDLDQLEHNLRYNYYGTQRYEKRMVEELFHYRQLKYSLLHKVEELHFFNNTDLENRKTVVLSNDCISSIQYLKRDDRSTLMIQMRSSDVDALLPLDLMALSKMLREVNNYYTSTGRVPYTGDVNYESLQVTIGSAHYYLSGGRDDR